MSDLDKTPRLTILGGGCKAHPVLEQAELLRRWLPDWELIYADGVDALDMLDQSDGLLVMGLHWTGWPDITWHEPGPYRAPNESQRQALRDFVASGKPVGVIHGGIGSFDDWPEFGQLLGFSWYWGITGHSRIGPWVITPVDESPLIDQPEPFTTTDELYGNVQITPGLPVTNHLTADLEGLMLPLLLTAEGGRLPGAGRCAWFGLGHDVKAWEQPRFRTLLVNTLNWLLQNLNKEEE